MPSIGWQELVIVLFLVLVIFGPKRLPEMGRSMGKGIREFRKSTGQIQEQLTQVKTGTVVAEKAEAVVVQESKLPSGS
ncbi:MAG: Sec-independent protein translocase subunit TatA/TatB [Thermoleophilia bacterium]